MRAGEDVEYGGEPAAGVGVVPGVQVGEQGGGRLPEFIDVRNIGVSGGGSGSGGLGRRLSGHTVRAALVGFLARGRGQDGGEDVQPSVKAGDTHAQHHRRCGGDQTQDTAEQSGAAAGSDQYGQAAGVAGAHLGQINDETAGVGPEHVEELPAQAGNADDVEFAAELGDGIAVLTVRDETQFSRSVRVGVRGRPPDQMRRRLAPAARGMRVRAR